MNRWTLGCGQSNFTVRISTVPLWRVVVEEVYNGVWPLLGHPCCWSLKWVPTERLRDWVAIAQFKILNNRFSFAASGQHEKTVETFHITEADARRISPDFVADMVDMDIFEGDDKPTSTFSGTSTTAATFTMSASNLTWTGLPNL